ncbi:hypothetical protein PROFUN_01539 [Planoprotostelium fungivorum]|uniref:Uncharacterized protein n=1 Tax=Planoprotostelium fungivorum TaxID=1890364 RepID=A0A2P6NTH5_9EUKA|nr:hypothetical protein PROFUN_01539 [Planoprotostelium fungivorum]
MYLSSITKQNMNTEKSDANKQTQDEQQTAPIVNETSKTNDRVIDQRTADELYEEAIELEYEKREGGA